MGESRPTTLPHPSQPTRSPDAHGCPSTVRGSENCAVPQPAPLAPLSESRTHVPALTVRWCHTDLNGNRLGLSRSRGPGYSPPIRPPPSESVLMVPIPSRPGPRSGCRVSWLADQMGRDVRLIGRREYAQSVWARASLQGRLSHKPGCIVGRDVRLQNQTPAPAGCVRSKQG